jgi:hypothetical protein
MIGSLMYAMPASQPDIAHAIRVLSRYNHDPSNEHMLGLKHVFRYPHGTKDWRLPFGGELRGAFGDRTLGLEGEGTPRCHGNSDYAGCPEDYKSTSGLVSTFGGVVDWRLRKQTSTAHSTTDAENYAFGVGCMRLRKKLHLLNELGIPSIPPVFSDSQSLIASINNRNYPRTAVAHIATKYYLRVDMARDGELNLSYVPTTEMLAH